MTLLLRIARSSPASLLWIVIVFQMPLAAASLTINYSADFASTCTLNGVTGVNGTDPGTGNPAVAGSLQSATGPITGALSCSGPNDFSITGNAAASYGAVDINATTTGFEVARIGTNFTDNVTFQPSADHPAGSQLRVSAAISEVGSMTYSGTQLSLSPSFDVALGTADLIDDGSQGIFCPSCTTTTVSLNRNFNTFATTVTVGQTYAFSFTFAVFMENAANSGELDIEDPDVPFLNLADAVSGAQVTDVVVQGDSGIIYADTAAVPEPSSVALAGLGLAGIAVAIRRKWFGPSSSRHA